MAIMLKDLNLSGRFSEVDKMGQVHHISIYFYALVFINGVEVFSKANKHQMIAYIPEVVQLVLQYERIGEYFLSINCYDYNHNTAGGFYC